MQKLIRFGILCLVSLVSVLIWIDDAHALPKKGGTLRVAIVAEPKSLDPMAETTNVISTISQHIFETLYSLGKKDKVLPVLASELPIVSGDGLTVRIMLRKDVKFHDGSMMSSNDVLASLERWLAKSVHGKSIADKVLSVSADGKHAVVFKLSQPLNQLPILLAVFNGAAIIMPAHRILDELVEYVGTGPYLLNKRVIGEYILLSRNMYYKSPNSQDKTTINNRMAYLDGIRFIPVAKAEDRLEGMLQGKFDYADELPPKYLSILEKADKQVRTEILESKSDTMLYFNTRQGVFRDRSMRLAVQSVLNPNKILRTAFGVQTQYTKSHTSYPAARILPIYEPSGALYPARYDWHTDVGTQNYSKPDITRAKLHAQGAQYDGSPIRILTSDRYYYHLRFALEAARQLKEAGFPSELEIVDWPTLLETRKNIRAWDIYFSHGPIAESPTLSLYFSGDADGWWKNPDKEALIYAFNRESNFNRQVAIFQKLQELVYTEAPIIKLGNISKIAATSRKLSGFKVAVWPQFWNVWLENDVL